MKIFTVLLFYVFVLNMSVFATTIGGTLLTNTTLDSTNNPYYVTSDLQVPIGVELHIGPGVIMYFSEEVSIKIGGLLRMEGTDSHPITLSPDSAYTKWGGLFFYDSAIDFDTLLQTGCLVNYVHSIRGGGDTGLDVYGYSNGYVLKALLSTVAIKNSVFENTVGAGFLFTQGGYFQKNEVFGLDFNMDHNYGDNYYVYFEDNYIHDITNSTFATVYITGKSIIKRNVFENCDYLGILRVSDDCIITDNQIINCPNSWGILLLGGNNHVVEKNIFDNNKIHIMQLCERHPIVNSNCFGEFEDYAVLVSSNISLFFPFLPYDCVFNGIDTIDYSNNYFENVDSTNINDVIYDYLDDVGDLLICNTFPLNANCSPPNFSTEENENIFFSIFPNPAVDKINIQLDVGFKYENYRIEMINQVGQIIYSNVIIDGLLTIDVFKINAGIYTLVITGGDNTRKIKKIIITH